MTNKKRSWIMWAVCEKLKNDILIGRIFYGRKYAIWYRDDKNAMSNKKHIIKKVKVTEL